MLQFKNTTAMEGTILLLPDPDGIESVYTIVKATLSLDNPGALSEEQAPIVENDEYAGEPGLSSLETPGDIALIKPGTDVLLQGSAHAPNGKAVAEMDVSLKVGTVEKSVHVYGDRVWESGVFRSKISKPEPFEVMPLVWERAFGGSDEVKEELQAENRNPVGTGFWVKNGKNSHEGMKLPNLEDAKQPVKSLSDRPAPAGFGPLCPHWEPRRSFAGTYDEAWEKKRAPYLPEDFDPRFFQLAPSDLIAQGYLKGGEMVEIKGASPKGDLRFPLPAWQIEVVYRLDTGDQTKRANLDTVLIQPDHNRYLLLWRTVLPCDKKSLQVREVVARIANGVAGAN